MKYFSTPSSGRGAGILKPKAIVFKRRHSRHALEDKNLLYSCVVGNSKIHVPNRIMNIVKNCRTGSSPHQLMPVNDLADFFLLKNHTGWFGFFLLGNHTFLRLLVSAFSFCGSVLWRTAYSERGWPACAIAKLIIYLHIHVNIT